MMDSIPRKDRRMNWRIFVIIAGVLMVLILVGLRLATDNTCSSDRLPQGTIEQQYEPIIFALANDSMIDGRKVDITDLRELVVTAYYLGVLDAEHGQANLDTIQGFSLTAE
jgi:hypothetical protein